MPRRFFVVIFLCVLFPASLSYGESLTEKETIALALPLTGPLAFLGENMRNGFELYRENHPEFAKVTNIVVEDTTTTEIGKGISAVRRLIDINKPSVFLLAVSPLLDSLKQEFDSRKLPVFAVIGSDAAKGMNFGFKFWIPAPLEFSVVAEALKRENYQRIAIVTTEQLAFIQREEGLLLGMNARGIEQNIIGKFRISSPDEITTTALKVSQLKPDAVVNLLLNGQAGLFARELARLGYKGRGFGSVVLLDPAELKISEGAVRGIRYPVVVPSKEFEALFSKRYGAAPQLGAANGYDIAMILHEALRKLGRLSSPEALTDFVKTSTFSGAMGSYRFDASGFNTFTFTPTLVSVP